MILTKLGRKFEILEARPATEENPTPVGGRLFTYYFDDAQTQFNYFDVGAIRFPYIPGMYPTFDMIDWLGLTKQMIPYVFKVDNTIKY